MKHLWKYLISVCVLLASTITHAGWTVRYQHTDVQGSVIAESNTQGTITQRFDYKPFGEGTPTQKSGVGFTGHLEDTDLGLTYMQQRYYDPVIGRFYSNDPVGFKISNPMMFNRYAYANNNPYKYTDPDGRDPDRLSGAVAGAMIQMYAPASAAQLASMTAAAGDSSYSAGVSAGIQVVEGARELANGASLSQVASNTVNRANVHGNSTSSQKPTQHYKHTDQNGKTYNGVGDVNGKRADQSRRRLERENPGKQFTTETKDYPTRADALKAEDNGIQSSGGPKSEGSYNQINSPGKKLNEGG